MVILYSNISTEINIYTAKELVQHVSIYGSDAIDSMSSTELGHLPMALMGSDWRNLLFKIKSIGEIFEDGYFLMEEIIFIDSINFYFLNYFSRLNSHKIFME
jgi:hypothetical protein